MDELAKRIHDYQVADIATSMRSTVIEYISSSKNNQKKDIPSETLEEMELEELYKLITPDIAVHCILRCCELLFETVHTHYLISQWHRSPFDAKNLENSYLHRCNAVLGEEEDLLESILDNDTSEEESEAGSGLAADRLGSLSQDSEVGGSTSSLMEAYSESIDSNSGEGTKGLEGMEKEGREGSEEDDRKEGGGDDTKVVGEEDKVEEGVGKEKEEKGVEKTDRTNCKEEEEGDNDNNDNNNEGEEVGGVDREDDINGTEKATKQKKSTVSNLFTSIRTNGNEEEEDNDDDYDDVSKMTDQSSPVASKHKLNSPKSAGRRLSNTALEKDFSINLENLKEEVLGENAEPVLLQTSIFKMVYSKLFESRLELWENVEDSIWLLFKNIPFTSSLALDDFLTMSWALNELVSVGHEFCRARSRALTSCIQEKSSKYFLEVHKDSFLMLRQVMDAEPWKCLPMDINEMGGVAGIVKMNLSRSQLSSSNKQKIRVKGLLKQNTTSEHAKTSSEKESDKDSAASTTTTTTPFTSTSLTDTSSPSPTAASSSSDALSILKAFPDNGNPFVIVSESNAADSSASDEGGGVLTALFDDNDEDSSSSNKKQSGTVVVTQSSLKGLSNFVGKYMQMMFVVKKGSSAAIFDDLCQLFDFYICSVFAGFVPEDQRQRLLSFTKQNAPPPDTAKDFQALKSYTFKNFDVIVPGQQKVEMEENPKKFSDIFSTPSVLQHDELLDSSDTSSIGTSTALNEHLVAAESCWFAAKILKDLKPKLLTLLPESHFEECTLYISGIQQVVGQLQSLVYRAICPQLCASNSVLTKLADCQWADSKKQSENEGKPNPWVDLLVANCKEVWSFLNEENEFSIVHEVARDQAWMELCQTAFDMTLDAISVAKKSNSLVGSNSTSSENCRQAMNADLEALQNSLDSIRSCRPARGKEHVEEFVRATGLSEDDTMQWVRDNWQMYAYRHSNSLIKQTLGSVMKKSKLKEALEELDTLYDQEQKFQKSVSKRRSMLQSLNPKNMLGSGSR